MGLEGFRLGCDGRLFQNGLIGISANRAMSVEFTDEGLQKAEELFKTLFTRQS